MHTLEQLETKIAEAVEERRSAADTTVHTRARARELHYRHLLEAKLKCDECGKSMPKKIYENREKCPHCGHKIGKVEESRAGHWIESVIRRDRRGRFAEKPGGPVGAKLGKAHPGDTLARVRADQPSVRGFGQGSVHGHRSGSGPAEPHSRGVSGNQANRYIKNKDYEGTGTRYGLGKAHPSGDPPKSSPPPRHYSEGARRGSEAEALRRKEPGRRDEFVSTYDGRRIHWSDATVEANDYRKAHGGPSPFIHKDQGGGWSGIGTPPKHPNERRPSHEAPAGGEYSPAEIDRAKAEIKRGVMARYGGDLLGPAIKGVEVSDDDAKRYLNGASLDDLLPGKEHPPEVDTPRVDGRPPRTDNERVYSLADAADGDPEALKQQPLSNLAELIRRDWGKVNFAAAPYLDAMHSLDSVDDDYYQDSGKSIVLYFLSNARSWQGPLAKAVKKELKRRVK